MNMLTQKTNTDCFMPNPSFPFSRLSAVVKKRKKRQVKEIQVATLASVFSRRSSIGQSFVGGSRRDQSSMLLSPTSPDGSHHAFFASKHGIISRQSSADTDDGYRHGSLPEEQAQALQASRSNSHLHTAPVSEVGRQLRQRGFCFKWVSRVVLLVFAVILLLPEPVQEMLLEEGTRFVQFVAAEKSTLGVLIMCSLAEQAFPWELHFYCSWGWT